MTRAARFSQADLTRAVRAAEKAGLSVEGYEIELNGTIRVLTAAPQAANDRRNPLDRLHHG
jgi:hypothetical protein